MLRINAMRAPHVLSGFLVLAVGALLPFACEGQQQAKESAAADPQPLMSPMDALNKLESPDRKEYKIGAGDELDVEVAGHPELSGTHIVGPDGQITVPIGGSFEIGDLSREEAASKVSAGLEHFYTGLYVTVRVSKYAPTRIVVFGHVDQPGVLYFDSPPTLLDVLSKSRRAALDAAGQQSALPKRCEIIRGKDQAVWIDLAEMLEHGNAGADLPLRRNDVVYVPNDKDDMITMLGEVSRPGMVRLEPTTTLMDALAMSGGLAGGAGNAKFEIVRPSTGATREITYNDLKNPAKAAEISLKPGDVVYVQKSVLAKFAYVLQQVSPVGGMLMFAAAVR
jgi:polysaccharide export outer membrane protein